MLFKKKKMFQYHFFLSDTDSDAWPLSINWYGVPIQYLFVKNMYVCVYVCIIIIIR